MLPTEIAGGCEIPPERLRPFHIEQDTDDPLDRQILIICQLHPGLLNPRGLEQLSRADKLLLLDDIRRAMGSRKLKECTDAL